MHDCQDNKQTSLWKQGLLAFILFLLLKYFFSYLVLSSFSTATIEAEFAQQDVIDIFYSSSQTFQPKLSARTAPFTSGVREKHAVNIKNHVGRYLRIDPGAQGGPVKLYSLELTSFFGPSIRLGPKQLSEHFTPNQHIGTFTLTEDCLLIVPQSTDPFIVSQTPLAVDNFFLSTTLPLIYSLVIVLLLSHFVPARWPPWHDLHHKTSSMGVQIGALDGIRGIAALMVLAEHTGILNGIGALGVYLFFALSGFLLATPFVQAPDKAVSVAYMGGYLLRRLKRIVPMYYTFLVITMLLRGKNQEFFRHLFFVQGDGHLWTIPQEMFFYLVLPFVMLGAFLLHRGGRVPVMLFLLGLIYLANTFVDMHTVPMYGYGRLMEPKIGIFLGGVLFSYGYHWLHGNKSFQKLSITFRQRFCSVAGLTVFALLVLLSSSSMQQLTQLPVKADADTIGFLAGLFILLVVLSGRTLLSRIMGYLPLRAIGLVGFSFYLLHPLLIACCRSITQYYFHFRLSGLAMFIAAGITTYLLSTLTYTLVERPFLHINQTKGPQQDLGKEHH